MHMLVRLIVVGVAASVALHGTFLSPRIIFMFPSFNYKHEVHAGRFSRGSPQHSNDWFDYSRHLEKSIEQCASTPSSKASIIPVASTDCNRDRRNR